MRRFLIVVMCLLMGGVAGMLFSHRGFSRLLDSQGTLIDYMRDEVKQLQKEEARGLHDKHKLQKEVAGYRNSLSEAQQDVEDLKRQIAELNTQLFTAREIGRLASQGRRAPTPVASPPATQPAIQPRPAPKAATCVTSGANPGADLLDCIDKLNRP